MKFRIGYGYDVHALGEGLPLILGGVEIEHAKGCIAHSDGDVVLHAISDALLGAAALGDIGLHFPDTSDEFKGADSKLLLARCVELLREKGYAAVSYTHLDVYKRQLFGSGRGERNPVFVVFNLFWNTDNHKSSRF